MYVLKSNFLDWIIGWIKKNKGSGELDHNISTR